MCTREYPVSVPQSTSSSVGGRCSFNLLFALPAPVPQAQVNGETSVSEERSRRAVLIQSKYGLVMCASTSIDRSAWSHFAQRGEFFLFRSLRFLSLFTIS